MGKQINIILFCILVLLPLSVADGRLVGLVRAEPNSTIEVGRLLGCLQAGGIGGKALREAEDKEQKEGKRNLCIPEKKSL